MRCSHYWCTEAVKFTLVYNVTITVWLHCNNLPLSNLFLVICDWFYRPAIYFVFKPDQLPYQGIKSLREFHRHSSHMYKDNQTQNKFSWITQMLALRKGRNRDRGLVTMGLAWWPPPSGYPFNITLTLKAQILLSSVWHNKCNKVS